MQDSVKMCSVYTVEIGEFGIFCPNQLSGDFDKEISRIFHPLFPHFLVMVEISVETEWTKRTGVLCVGTDQVMTVGFSVESGSCMVTDWMDNVVTTMVTVAVSMMGISVVTISIVSISSMVSISIAVIVMSMPVAAVISCMTSVGR